MYCHIGAFNLQNSLTSKRFYSLEPRVPIIPQGLVELQHIQWCHGQGGAPGKCC